MQRFIDELTLLHAIRLAVVATDDAGVITFVNDAATQAYAADADQLLGRNVRELLGDRARRAPPPSTSARCSRAGTGAAT